MLLAGTIFIILLCELFVFNRGAVLGLFFKQQERHYTIHDGTLYQMELKNGKLVSQGYNPMITFKDVNMYVDRVAIVCQNFKAQERGQVFFRAADEDFTWANSVSYETSTNLSAQMIDLPGVPMVSSLRFALTHSENDVVKCNEFVTNPHVPFNIRFRRVAVYIVFVLLAASEIVKKLLSRNENQEGPFPSLTFQRLAIPFLAICLVFPDVVFLGASLRITDQVHGSYFRFPPITFYPHYAHHQWQSGRSDYIAAVYQSEPMMEFMARSLREGESPYWNPYSAAGSLGPETLVDNKFSVFTLAYAFLGGGQKLYNIIFLFIYFLGAYFTYRLIREKLQLSFLAALTGMFFFLLNGYATANVGSNVNQSYLFVPMCLYASFSLLEKPTSLRIVGVVLSFAAFFSYTFIPTALTGLAGMYVVLLGFVLMLYRKVQTTSGWALQALAAHAICVMASILLLAFIYFPILENLHSTDTVNVYSERTFRSLSWIMIPSVFSSSHVFESSRPLEQGVMEYITQRNKAMIVYCLGTVALTLAMCSLSFKRPIFTPFVLLCMLAILIGFGRIFNVPGISSLISNIPVISYMIGSQYWWPIIVIPLIFLVALGVDNLQNRFVVPIVPFLLLPLVVGSLIAVEIVYGIREPNVWYKGWSTGLLLTTAVVSPIATAISAYTSRGRLRTYVAIVLMTLAFIELTMDSKPMRFAPNDLFTNHPPEITFIKKNIGLYRTLTIGPEFGVRHELGSAFSIQEVTAINLGNLSHYMEYFHTMVSLDPDQRLFYDYYPSLRTMLDTPDKNTIHWAAVDLLGIKYIITPRNFPHYRQVFIDHGLIPVLDTETVYVYENPHVLPRAFMIDRDSLQGNGEIFLSPDDLSKLKPANIPLYRNNEVLLEGTASKPSLLVLTDNWHANWKAFVNGVQTDILRVHGTFRGVQVPAGQYKVRFYYQPRTLHVAILTSGIMTLFLAYFLIDHKRVDSFLAQRLHTSRAEA